MGGGFTWPHGSSKESYGPELNGTVGIELGCSSEGRLVGKDGKKLSVEHLVLLNYVGYKQSVMSLGENQSTFINHMHETVCCFGAFCNCQWYGALVSHFEACCNANCHVCVSVRNTFPADRLNQGSRKRGDTLLRSSNGGEFGWHIVERCEYSPAPSKRVRLGPVSLRGGISRILAPSMDQAQNLQSFPSLFTNSDVIEENAHILSRQAQGPGTIREIQNKVADFPGWVPTRKNVVPEEIIFSGSQDVVDPMKSSRATNFAADHFKFTHERLSALPQDPTYNNQDKKIGRSFNIRADAANYSCGLNSESVDGLLEEVIDFSSQGVVDPTKSTKVATNFAVNPLSLSSETLLTLPQQLIYNANQDVDLPCWSNTGAEVANCSCGLSLASRHDPSEEQSGHRKVLPLQSTSESVPTLSQDFSSVLNLCLGNRNSVTTRLPDYQDAIDPVQGSRVATNFAADPLGFTSGRLPTLPQELICHSEQVMDLAPSSSVGAEFMNYSCRLSSERLPILSEEESSGHEEEDFAVVPLRSTSESVFSLSQDLSIDAIINMCLESSNNISAELPDYYYGLDTGSLTKLSEEQIIGHKPEDFTSSTKIAPVVEDCSSGLSSERLSTVSIEPDLCNKLEDIAVNLRILHESCPSSFQEHIFDDKPQMDFARNVADASCGLNSKCLPIQSEEHINGQKSEELQVDANTCPCSRKMQNDYTAVAFQEEVRVKPEHQKLKGVSLIEFCTLEQIKEHISTCKQRNNQVGPFSGKDENMLETSSCSLCSKNNFFFAPSPIYCLSCGARIRLNKCYYCVNEEDCTKYCFCASCYKLFKENITICGLSISKAKLVKKKNDELDEESWVQCDKCKRWQHQICALYNHILDMEGQADYICPECHLEEREAGKCSFNQMDGFGAKHLSRTMLSDHIEQRVLRCLNQERDKIASAAEKDHDEVPAAEDLTVRVVSSVDQLLKVDSMFLEIYGDQNYPPEFPYKSKKIEGVDVCLFGMYVQEFGSDCGYPNQRCVYISYLDSVKYFKAGTESVTGESFRTLVYHEILIGYLDYCKKRGFTTCHIWACPSSKGEDYIFNCHPETQKTPKPEKLRRWYQTMLKKASDEDIVVDITNIHDHFFVRNGDCNFKVTAARLPHFYGKAEKMIRKFGQESQKVHKKMDKSVTKRILKSLGHTNSSSNTIKDIMLMQELGQAILPLREAFIIVHLQFVCTNCHEAILSGKRWSCGLCVKIQLCERCHKAGLNESGESKHTIEHGDKHVLSEFMVDDVPLDTYDKDKTIENELFDNRLAFLTFCQQNHYQFDSLRRAKHSTMMILYHLHNPLSLPKKGDCRIFEVNTGVGQAGQSKVCGKIDVSPQCFLRRGSADHVHDLTQVLPMADKGIETKEARSGQG
ncbi:Histone acetyltransferase Rtt109/CBP [Dillenia turbinata]|uniref:histone acetyltransferase n=1 Tax=Dillenia turbinata TaxID=194707 RepID=A0AAN8VNS9_9MAGN